MRIHITPGKSVGFSPRTNALALRQKPARIAYNFIDLFGREGKGGRVSRKR